jgi:hypothetical protein
MADLGTEAGVPAPLVSRLLDDAALSAIRPRCHRIQPELRALCQPAQVADATARIDRTLASWLGSESERHHMLAVELSIALGARGTAIARQAMQSRVPAEDPQLQAVSGLIVLSWTLPRQEAISALTPHLERPAPLAVAAALELGRLGAEDSLPAMRRLSEAMKGSAEGVVVEYAAALASGEAAKGTWPPSQAVGL